MTDITSIMGGPYRPKQTHVDPPEVQLADAMRGAGIEPPASIKIDGQLHRFGTKGRKKDDSGWYIAFPDGIPAGRFGCWRDGVEVNWRAEVGRELTAAEQMAITRRTAEARAARDAERERKHTIAADTVEVIWSDAGPASPDHPYLKRKGIQPHGARITGDGRLMVPLFSPDGTLKTLQYISEDGEKRYHPGGTTKDCGWLIGDLDRTLYIAEGFATAATIQEVTNEAVAIAYSAGNLVATTAAMRAQFPNTPIVIVADNDESGVGKNYADQAAAKYGARVIMPPISGDANDYKAAGHDLHALLNPPVVDWLIHADEFAHEPAPLTWRIKHWVQDGALHMIHGPSGGGKTFVILDMCLSIASGKTEWFGHKVRPGRVVYLAGEGHHGLKGRIAGWKQHHGVSKLDMYVSRAGCDLNTPEGYQKATQAIQAIDAPPAVVVVDTVHRFMVGDENSAQDTKTMLDACAAIHQEYGCIVILIHHTGVSEEAQHRARGSSAWRGALDIEISVAPPKRDGDSISIIQRKAKDTELADDIYVDLQQIDIKGWLDEDGEKVTTAVLTAGTEPVKPKADNAETKAKKLLERAWFSDGAPLKNGTPHITKKGYTAFLAKQGYADATIAQHLKPSASGKPLGLLLLNGVLEPAEDGWMVADKVWANAIITVKNGS